MITGAESCTRDAHTFFFARAIKSLQSGREQKLKSELLRARLDISR